MQSNTSRLVGVNEGTRFLGRVFAYMFLGLAITAVVAVGLGYLLNYYLSSGFNNVTETALQIYLGLIIGSTILSLILTFVIRFVLLRGRHSIMVPYILYTITMGVLLSSFTLFLSFYELALGVGITAVTFGILALVGYFGGERIRLFGLIGFGLLIGALIISLFSLIWYFISPATYVIMDTIVSAIMFLAILFITAFDMYRVRQIAEDGSGSNNLALYCAFSLYVDFIYILIRILLLIARFSRRN